MSGALLRLPAGRGPRYARTLTARELEVLQLVAEGYTNQEIGRALGISVATSKNHVNHIAMRLGALNRAHTVALGMARGLVELAPLEGPA